MLIFGLMVTSAKKGHSPLIEVRGITKSYGQTTATRNIPFVIGSGESLGMMGPNGAGKTKLFECLAGVQPFDSGSISLAVNFRREETCSGALYGGEPN